MRTQSVNMMLCILLLWCSGCNVTNEVEVYYADTSFSKLVYRKTSITFLDTQQKISSTLIAMQHSPDVNSISLTKGIRFQTIQFEEQSGTLYLDLAFQESGNLGSSGEGMLLNAVSKSLFQFPEIREIYITKDGIQEESLMGHFELPYPLTRDHIF
jgi:hypothetical protein